MLAKKIALNLRTETYLIKPALLDIDLEISKNSSVGKLVGDCFTAANSGSSLLTTNTSTGSSPLR